MIGTDIINVTFDEDDIFGMEFTELQKILIRAGKDCTHKWNGTELTVTSASGTSSADLKGAPGVGIASFEMEFYASDADTYLVGGQWSSNIPDAESGKYLWVRYMILYEDDRIEYSHPARSPIWESVNAIPSALSDHTSDRSNPHMVTLAQLGGLGYKRLLNASDDFNSVTDNGVYVYSTSSVPKNAPFANAAVVLVFGAGSTSTQKIQLAFRYGVAGCCKFRPLYSNQWLEWAESGFAIEDENTPGSFYRISDNAVEWVNPPLLDSVEYRTAERFRGEPVYVKMLDIGSLPSNGTKTVASGCTINELVSVDATTVNASGTKSVIPFFTTSGTLYARFHITNAGTIAVTSFSDLSSYKAKFILKYTK